MPTVYYRSACVFDWPCLPSKKEERCTAVGELENTMKCRKTLLSEEGL